MISAQPSPDLIEDDHPISKELLLEIIDYMANEVKSVCDDDEGLEDT